MSAKRGLAGLGLCTALLVLSLGCTCLSLVPTPPGNPMCLEFPYSPPPPNFQRSDLAGIWETRYGRSVDRLTIRGDGTFQQVYQDVYVADYLYETPWSPWWIERLEDGQVRLHFEGARYYLEGRTIAERDGLEAFGEPDPPSMPFFDPISEDAVSMVGELVLNVRVDSSEELLLLHLWTHHDRGYGIFGCQTDYFRRVDAP